MGRNVAISIQVVGRVWNPLFFSIIKQVSASFNLTLPLSWDFVILVQDIGGVNIVSYFG